MKNFITHKAAIVCISTFFCYSLSAQNTVASNASKTTTVEVKKRVDNYKKLKSLGYTDKEIYEDLGNANFLVKKYETAAFWYKKLKDVSKDKMLNKSYQERYQFALKKVGVSTTKDAHNTNKDWMAAVANDYKTTKQKNNTTYTGKYGEYSFNPKGNSSLETVTQQNNYLEEITDKHNAYKTPVAVTADGKTAYFSKGVYVKPATGIFSKKELVHKIYRAENVNGQWKNVKEIALAPKNYSAMHPTVSADGKRLFFASNMPGTFGKFDIYVASIKANGDFGVAKNLGQKVNTEKNDLYPKIVNGNSLFFASNGHKGYGGLDIYMVEVGQRKVGIAANLGSRINSDKDDFSLDLQSKNGMGYVMSNRGQGNVERVAFTYTNKNRDFNSLEAVNDESSINYSTSVFED
ncbi:MULTISPECIES: PD40 domain-containing protein [Cellulophaga]|uniref:WD40-like beta Propeller containing protein n=2 Tax=Cellulophaga TaxID=104264 RepID=F0RDX9_CELLC|nr:MULTISPECIES: PD40 domain-containing protein [Cellulophaga]ADY30934.1 WD40-like beta Propeller containing protein [Cellulophaga lytica DSM 7489]AIM61907.1 cell envelope biogenesis protein OmpA [Cellulophaga lytica]EWH13452.1 WD40-like beta Propeller containing protein [Cellulophaga geojensis KL-A]TVZ09741.1 WD40 repeat protein [Cellulophaga sp. RHA_52]WQG78152.1 PD40 domain-containing protein [Cellulophaga lytica]